tara:strand:+ start:1721 stop:4531 length:2811 start_codon:yes stop_codon:yes gene_type:complete
MACEASVISNRINESLDDYFNHPPTLKIVGGDGNAFKKLYRASTGKDFDYGDMPTEKELDRLDRRIEKFQKRLLKGAPGKIAALFYLPDEFLKGNPDAAKTFDAFVINHNHYRGTKDKLLSDVLKMSQQMRKISKDMALINDGSAKNYRSATKELQRRYNEYMKLKETGKPGEAEDYYDDKLSDLGKREQFKVFEMADRLLRNPKLIGNEDYAPFKPILDLWTNMRPVLFKEMKSALGKYIDMLARDNNANQYASIIDRLKFLDKNLVGEKNYFPTQVLSIFPTMKKIQDTIYQNKDMESVSFEDLSAHVDNMVDNVIKKIGVTDHARPREMPNEKRYNKNIIGVLDAYVNDVTRFNYMVNTTGNLLNGIKNLRGQSDGEITNSTRVYMDYLFDTHATMLGYNVKSPTFRSLARGLTSWQFISKLGLNLRSAARNATQSFQNIVFFGFKGLKDANSYLKDSKMADTVKTEMERHGVYFAEVRELAGVDGIFPDTDVSKVDGREVVTWKADSMKDKFLSGLEKVAKTTGWPMRYVENKFNRSYTFKLAFAQMHEQLNKNKGDVTRFIIEHGGIKKGAMSETEYGDVISKEVNNHIINKASRFAAETVKLLHYEYSSFAKPKIMQHPAGAVAGQFMTYSFNFFNYQRKILKTGISDMVKNDWKSEDAFRVYRLGMLYAFINGVLSLAFNTDFGNLVQNDTYDRANQFVAWTTGTEEEKKKAFYGKGPIIGTIGGPFISDMVTMGNLAGIYDLLGDFDEGDRTWLGYLAGYQDYAEKKEDEKSFEFWRTINSQIGRTAFASAPRAYNGAGFGTIAALELGLYPSAKIKERKAKVIKAAQKLPVVGKMIPTPSYAKKKKSKRKKPVTKEDRVMQALASLGKTGSRDVGTNQWISNIIKSQRAYGASLQPLKGNMSRYNSRLMSAAVREGYVGDFDQGTWT